MQKLLRIQTLVLLGGTIVAWVTVYTGSSHCYLIYSPFPTVGLYAAQTPQPAISAIAMLIALIFSIHILRAPAETRPDRQKYLLWFLGAATLFTLWRLIEQLIKFYNIFYHYLDPGQYSCAGYITNPFLTPDFFASAFSLLALVIGSIAFFSAKKPTA
jgi:hypothetical protein